MEREWTDTQPIYRQLRDRVVALMLDGAVAELAVDRLGVGPFTFHDLVL